MSGTGLDAEEFDVGALETNAQTERVEWAGGGKGRRKKSGVVARKLTQRSPLQRTIRWGIALLLLAALAQEAVAVYYERQMTDAAQSLSGRTDIDVRCGRLWDLVTDFQGSTRPGYVYWDSTTANLQLPQCINAAGFADDPLDEGNRIGMMVLTHEVAHLSGHRNESQTECVAMWAAPQTAVALGGTLAQGQATAQWYATAYNPRMPVEYQAPGCLSGPKPDSRLLR